MTDRMNTIRGSRRSPINSQGFVVVCGIKICNIRHGPRRRDDPNDACESELDSIAIAIPAPIEAEPKAQSLSRFDQPHLMFVESELSIIPAMNRTSL